MSFGIDFKSSRVFSNKPILVASPPSSGSTLLAVMLDNHPLISCGPETSLMGNPLFYNNPNALDLYIDFFFNEHVKFNQLNGIVTLLHGLAPTGIIYEDHLASYNITLKDIRQKLKKSNNSIQAIDEIYGHRACIKNKRYIAEKTPGNFFALDDFFKNIPDGKVILIARHPYDQIYSLMKRGYDFSYAACCWISHTARCLRYKDHPNVFLLKFEQIINDTYNTWKNLFNFLEIDDHVSSIQNLSTTEWDATNGSYQINTWSKNPTQSPSKSAIGQGKKFLTYEQMLTLNHLQAELNIFDDYMAGPNKEKDVNYNKVTFTELCNTLQYPLIDIPVKFDMELLLKNIENICFAHESIDMYNTSSSFPFWETSLVSNQTEILISKKNYDRIKNSVKEKFERQLHMVTSQNLKLISLLQGFVKSI